MAKNTVGQFIAALRKANGMTQQEVADRLNVSNKAVSRWERDECSPDITLIPAIAEMFGVTCDELLRGERISHNSDDEQKKPKTEKQLNAMLGRTVSGFKTMIYISFAVSVIGLVCMFGISYGAYLPVIGFSVMLLFEICACAITVLALTKAKDIRNSELFAEISDAASAEYEKTIGNLSFASFFAMISVILLSLPLIIVSSDYKHSVLTFDSYLTSFFPAIALVLLFVYFRFGKTFADLAVGKRRSVSAPKLTEKSKMTFIQTGLTVIAGILFIIAPYFDTNPYSDGVFEPPLIPVVIGLGCLAASIVYFIVIAVRNKSERKETVFFGIRNTLLIPSSFIVSECHYTGWTYNDPESPTAILEPYDVWQAEYLWYAIGYAMAIIMIFSLIKFLTNNIAKK